ncbi:MAG: dihydrofolate reductase family protein, partial [Chloroflexi bacterium]|nr:dihydrofolate reductase family protein [Chloroflexota bacterium]
TSVLVEGGETLLGSLFDLGLVDKVVAFVAPVILGGRDAPSPVGGEGVSAMAEAMRLKRTRVDVLGPDVVITGYVR